MQNPEGGKTARCTDVWEKAGREEPYKTPEVGTYLACGGG